MSYRTEHDSWPYLGTRRQAEEDARYDHKNRDLYNRYGTDQQRVYREEYDRQEQRIEDRKREEREQEEREQHRRHEAILKRQREEQWEYERQQEQQQQEEEEVQEDIVYQSQEGEKR